MKEITTISSVCWKFKLVILFILAGFSYVKTYSIVQAPDNPAPTFKIYWNVPTFQCMSKGIPFTHIYKDYGIIQNEDDRFRGDKVSIIYNPGKFPLSTGKDTLQHGGIPQRGKLEEHLEAFKIDLERDVPDDAFDGVGIIDMEGWKPVYHQNYGKHMFVKNESYRHEKDIHGWWKEPWLQAEAKRNFELSARVYMEKTLELAKELRPLAQWGYYGYPYCFNMQGNKQEACSIQTKRQNDEAYWLWAGSTALYPSVYSGSELSSSQLASLIRGRVAEAKRVAFKDTPIFPYFQLHYVYKGTPIDKFITKKDLETALDALHKSNASGVMIWGNSDSVNTVDKCNRLRTYVNEVLGPAVVNYTKPTTSKATDKDIKPWSPTLVDLILINIANTTSNIYSKEDITIVVIHKSYPPTALQGTEKLNCSGAAPLQISFNEIHNYYNEDVLKSNKNVATENSNINVVNSTSREKVLNDIASDKAVVNSNNTTNSDKIDLNNFNSNKRIVDVKERNYSEENVTKTFLSLKENNITEENATKVMYVDNYTKENNTEENDTESNYTEESVTEINSTERDHNVKYNTERTNTEQNVTKEFYTNENNSTEENITEVTYIERDTENNYTADTEANFTNYKYDNVTEINTTERNFNKQESTTGNYPEIG